MAVELMTDDGETHHHPEGDTTQLLTDDNVLAVLENIEDEHHPNVLRRYHWDKVVWYEDDA